MFSAFEFGLPEKPENEAWQPFSQGASLTFDFTLWLSGCQLRDARFVRISRVVTSQTSLNNNCLIGELSLNSMVTVLKRRNLNISVPEDLVRWLDEEAARQGRSRNNLINWILNQHRKKDTKTF